jgi:hypothetical protein
MIFKNHVSEKNGPDTDPTLPHRKKISFFRPTPSTLPRRYVFLCDSAVVALDSCQTDPYTIYDFLKTRFRKKWAGHGSDVATPYIKLHLFDDAATP